MGLVRKITVYITIFFASMASASLFGISLTKLAFIPLLIVLLIDSLNDTVKLSMKSFVFIGFYTVIILSSLYGLCMTENYELDSYEYKLTYGIIQCILIYIPVVVLLFNNYKKDEYCNNIKKALISLARISSIWGILQFVFWSFWRIDFNNAIFNDFFNGFFGEINGARYQVLENGSWNISIRISGLSHEPAIFCMILLLGIIFDNKRWIKFIYAILIFLSLSRAGILVLLVLLGILFIKNIKNLKKSTIIYGFSIFVLLGLFLAMIFTVDSLSSLRIQFEKMLERFSLINNSEENIGTYRHINYIGWSIDSWCSDLNIFQKMFGIGYRVSGVALSHNSYYSTYLEENMINSAWAIECDFADILLGTGLVGLCIYIYIWGSVFRKGNFQHKLLCIVFVVFGIFYNVSIWTLSMIIMMFATLNIENDKILVSGDAYENPCYRCEGSIRL